MSLCRFAVLLAAMDLTSTFAASESDGEIPSASATSAFVSVLPADGEIPSSSSAFVSVLPATHREKSIFDKKAFVGKGRHGTKSEQALHAARAREGRATRRALKLNDESQQLAEKLALVASGIVKVGGNKFCRKITFADMLEVHVQGVVILACVDRQSRL